MFKNNQFQKEIDRLIREKKVKIKYPKGYQHWRKRFHSTLRETKGDVNKALDKIHGKTPNDSNGQA